MVAFCHYRSDGTQIVGRGLARPSIGYDLERDLLSLIEAMHSGAFDGADVHEHILAAVIRLNEAEAFLAIEPLYRSLRHMTFLSVRVWVAARWRSRLARDLGEGRQSDAHCATRAKSFGRSSIAAM
jgi:hypothetical protein